MDSSYFSAGTTSPLTGTIVSDLVLTFEEKVYLEQSFFRAYLLSVEGPNGVNSLVEGGMFGNLHI